MANLRFQLSCQHQITYWSDTNNILATSSGNSSPNEARMSLGLNWFKCYNNCLIIATKDTIVTNLRGIQCHRVVCPFFLHWIFYITESFPCSMETGIAIKITIHIIMLMWYSMLKLNRQGFLRNLLLNCAYSSLKKKTITTMMNCLWE